MLRFCDTSEVEKKVFMVMFVSSLFFFFSFPRIIGTQVVVCLSPLELSLRFQTHGHTHTHTQRIVSARYWQNNLLGDEQTRRSLGWEKKKKKKGRRSSKRRPGVLWFGGPREKDAAVDGSYSRLRTATQEQVTHMANAWRRHLTHTFAHGYTNTRAPILKHICSLSICHTRICVCARSCKTKLAVSYSQAVETDLPQCLHCLRRGERDAERDAALYGGESGLPWRICGGETGARADVAAVRVRRFHACCSKCRTVVQTPERNCWRRRRGLHL